MNGENHLDTLLAHYARGALSAPLHALVASHLVIRPESRPFVGALESVVASAIAEEEPAQIRNREERLKAIFAIDPEAPARTSPAIEGRRAANRSRAISDAHSPRFRGAPCCPA